MRKMMPASKQERILEAFRAAERDAEWIKNNPDALKPYWGEWVVIHNGRVVAHSPDAAEAATKGSHRTYPNSTIRYVPTEEERRAVYI